jgi:hypothetical protein
METSEPTRRTAPALLRAIAPLTALVYPGLIWCGVHLSPAFLALSLAVPAIALAAAHLAGTRGASPLVRWVGHLAVAAPPLYALLGGWLDFQHAVPIDSLGVWLALWSSLSVATLLDRRLPPQPIRAPHAWLAAAHAISGAAVALFASAHLANHLAGLFGGDAHAAVMRALRTAYRNPLVEPALLAAVGFQVASGAWLLGRKLHRLPDRFDTVQTATAAYLIVFFASHVSAVLRARLLHHVDTSWTWLSGGELLSDPWSARLVPYYFLAVVARPVHIACGLRAASLARGRPTAQANQIVVWVAGAALLASSLILVGLFRA